MSEREELFFIFDEDPKSESYEGHLYDVLDGILTRIEKLEKRSHIHKAQLPSYKPK